MEVISVVDHHPEEFISPIFIVPKKDGEYRMILNLKDLNEYIEYHHFKMDTFESVIKLVKPNCFFASVDLRHAYYSVPIAPEHRIKLRFIKSGVVYQYECLPNGVACAPRQFTRLLKPVFASLRMLGNTLSGFIDDSILIEDTALECERNIHDTVNLMTDVGFIVHENKSVLVPTQKITFLGNVIDSTTMTVTLPVDKVLKVSQACLDLQNKSFAKIRDVAKVLGLMISTFSAVEFAPLHYRSIEREKIISLQNSYGDYDATMKVSSSMKKELQWWIENLTDQKRTIDHGNPDILIITDASNSGWGAVHGDMKIGGRWHDHEAQNHINFLELLAVSHALKSFCLHKANCHVQIHSDNTCAISYIRKMGGKIQSLNDLAKEIWLWACERNIWLSATYVPGSQNVADSCSRLFQESAEWMLDTKLFIEIVQVFGKPDIDMFASRLNFQVEQYVSWKPDPGAQFVDAFSLDWSGKYIYAFPPFSLVGRLIQKVRADAADMILVAPLWVTQNWFTAVLELLVEDPLILKVKPQTLVIPGLNKAHPLENKLHLMVCHISGVHSRAEIYRKSLLKFSWLPGENLLRSNINVTSKSGFFSVVKGKKIYFKLL